MEDFGICPRAAELVIVDTALWDGPWRLRTLILRKAVNHVAEVFRRQGVEMRFKHFRPAGSISLRLKVKVQGLKPIVVVDTVNGYTIAWFIPTNEIHLLKLMQVGCYEASNVIYRPELSGYEDLP